MSPDNVRSVAFDPATPPDERNDALAELQKSHMPSNVLTPETLVRIFEMAEYSPMNKAIDKNVVPFPGLRPSQIPPRHITPSKTSTRQIGGNSLPRIRYTYPQSLQ